MKLNKIFDKLGKQTIKDLNQTAYVIVNGEKLAISRIKYENGKILGFEVDGDVVGKWFPAEVRPEEGKYVVVKDDEGKEYSDITWNGHCWYSWSIDEDGDADGYPETDINIKSWKYQDTDN